MAKQHSNALTGWSSRWTFVLAATGSAIGLGNIWKFPYIAGENGGGAFVLLYLVCLALVGIPLLFAELMLGRRARHNPIRSMQYWVRQARVSRHWVWLGRLSVLVSFMILSFYAVVGGMALAYIFYSALGEFVNAEPRHIVKVFRVLQGDVHGLMVWHIFFMLLVLVVSVRGLRRGLERSIRVIMPALLMLLIGLLVYAWQFGALETSARFMFGFSVESLTWEGVLDALSHAFYTLSLGMGAMFIYGAYMAPHASMSISVVSVALLDTLVALLAGLVIFALIFAHGLDASGGFALMFHTLPLAFGHLPMGQFMGSLFFVLVALAAWSSAIALLEPSVAWFEETTGWSRGWSTCCVMLGAWLLGLGTVFSFNIWQDATTLGQGFFSWINFVSSGVLVPIIGILIAVFSVWILSPRRSREALGVRHDVWYSVWRWVTGTVAIAAVAVVLVAGIIGHGTALCGNQSDLPWCEASESAVQATESNE